ncbi:MAG: hypothetical protein LUG13_05645 [Oscillospiraceae bacterium]|nr:hypothetical protein [Oscillospiraceae bacterium]
MIRSTSRANLFLIELVINLLLFGLCAAVCVSLLLAARSMGQKSERLTQGLYIAQSAAEQLRAGITPPTEWEGGYTVLITDTQNVDQNIPLYRIEVLQNGESCFTLEEVAIP